MALLRQGDSKAFEEIIQRYQTAITQFIFRIIKDSNRSLDLSQETFLKVFQHVHRYTPKASFSTWIYTIASNLAKDELRQKRNKWMVSLSVSAEAGTSNLADIFPDPKALPEKELEQKERQKIVWEILETISEPYRTTLILRDFQDLSYEEIAQIEACSLGTVKSRVNRARLQFKEKYTVRYLNK